MILYTFRNEYEFLLWDYGQDPYEEYQRFLDLGIDGYFTDFAASLHRFLESKRAEHNQNNVDMLMLQLGGKY